MFGKRFSLNGFNSAQKEIFEKLKEEINKLGKDEEAVYYPDPEVFTGDEFTSLHMLLSVNTGRSLFCEQGLDSEGTAQYKIKVLRRV